MVVFATVRCSTSVISYLLWTNSLGDLQIFRVESLTDYYIKKNFTVLPVFYEIWSHRRLNVLQIWGYFGVNQLSIELSNNLGLTDPKSFSIG